MSIKKPSLFSRQMNLKPRISESSGPVIQEIREKSYAELEQLEKESQDSIPSVQIPEIFHPTTPIVHNPSLKLQEDEKIHDENLKKLSQMSTSEIQDNLKEIQGTLSESTIEFLRKRGQAKLKKPQNLPTKDLQESEIESLSQAANRTCLHLPTLKCDLDRIRYNYEGVKVQQYINGHWEGELQGFTLRETVNLLRSTIPSQRSLAAETLSLLLASDFPQRIQFLIDECELARVLVFALTEKNSNVNRRVFSLLASIFNENLSKNLKIQKNEEFLFPAVESKANFLLPKAVREGKNIWECEESQNLIGFFSEPGKDFVVDLLTYGILDLLIAYELSDIVGIVLGICLHSVSACFVVVRHAIFEKLVKGGSCAYGILTVLAKSSVPAAFKISQNLPQQFLADLLLENSSIGLLFALFVHKQVFDIRVIAFEKAQEGNWEIISAVTRLIQSYPTNEYIGIAELVYYKYLLDWEQYRAQTDLLSSSLNLITAHINSGIKFNYSLEKLQGVIKNILVCVDLQINLSFTNTGERVLVNDLELFFNSEELENGICRQVRLLNSCLRFIIASNENNEKFLDVFHVIREAKDKVVRELRNVIRNLIGFSAVPRIVCYRLKDLVYFAVNCFEVLQEWSKDDVLVVVLFLATFDEVVFLNLLNKLFVDVPEYYKGYLNSDKNLTLSAAYHNRSCKVPTFFVGLNENPYLPLPFDWLFAPLPASENLTVQQIFNLVLNTSTYSNFYPLTGIILDLNGFFTRKDSLYLEFSHNLQTLISQIMGNKYFGASVNQAKNSVLNTTREYISTSYLENVFSIWVLSFMRDDVDSDIFKDVFDELELLLSRLNPAACQFFQGRSDLYSKLNSCLDNKSNHS